MCKNDMCFFDDVLLRFNIKNAYAYFDFIFLHPMSTHTALRFAIREMMATSLRASSVKEVQSIAERCGSGDGLFDVLLAISVVCTHAERLRDIKLRYMPLYNFLRYAFTTKKSYAKMVHIARSLFRSHPEYGIVLRACLCMAAFSRGITPVWTKLSC